MSKIIEENEFESLRLFDSTTQMHQCVEKRLKKIFENLFQGTEANVDDFYFSVTDEEDLNAFFLNKENTIEKKQHVIAVTRGLIAACQNEAELAGIIGHECGHFLWGELLKGSNTIFQEHAADLRAVDLLINGGYNPRNHLAICGRIFSDYGRVRYSDINVGVHGNGLARIDDIKDYMTKIASEKGDFPPLEGKKDIDYETFQQEVKNAYEIEGYDTYIEKCFKRDLGTKDFEKINVFDVMNVLLKEMKDGNITPQKTVRFNEMFNIISKYSGEHIFDTKSLEMTNLCQDFFMEVYNQISNTKYNDSKKQESDENKLNSMLYSFRLETFGDFKKQKENVEHFVNYKDKEDAVFWAKEMYKLSWTLPYAHCFVDDDYPHLEPKREKNIGKKLPWDELLSFCDDDSKKLRWAINTVYSNNSSWFQKLYSHQQFNNEEYFLDENSIVLAYGEEAVRLNKDKEFKRKNMLFIGECERCNQEFNENFEFFETLALFDTEKDEAKKDVYAEKLAILIQKPLPFSLTYFDDRYLSPANLQNPYVDEIKETYDNSLTKKHFISSADAEVRYLAHLKRIEDRKNKEADSKKEKSVDEYQKYLKTLDDIDVINRIYDETNIKGNSFFQQKVVLALIKLANRVKEKDELLAFNIYEKTYEYIYTRFSHIYNHYNSRKYNEHSNQYYENAHDLRNNFYRYSLTIPLCVIYSKLDIIVTEEFEIKHLSSSKTLERAMKTLGINPDCSFSEKLQYLDDSIGNEITMYRGYDRYRGDIYEAQKINGSLFDEDFRTIRNCRVKNGILRDFYGKAGFLMLANDIKKGNDYDLVETMKYLRCYHYSSYYSPLINDMIAKSIQEKDKFNTLPLEDKIFVYEVMEEKGIFSEKYANKLDFFKTIVKEIVSEKDIDKAMEYTEKLLSKQYVKADFDGGKIDDIEFAKEKDILISFYALRKSDELGIDDGSDEFLRKATKCADEICDKLRHTNENGYLYEKEKFPRDTRRSILEAISTNVVSQELTAQMFEEKGKIQFSGKDANKYDYHARAMLAIVSLLAKNPNNAKVVIDFLSSKCTDKSIEKVFESIPEDYDLRRGKELSIDVPGFHYSGKLTFDKSTLKMLHENFWHADLPARAYIMKRILNAYTSDKSTEEEKNKKKLDLVVDMYFDKKSPYYKDAKLIVGEVYNNLQDYEQDLILGALVSANQQNDNNERVGGEAVGEGLKMFFENKGPAFVKFGQMLSYLPQLDPEIRKPLAKLRDKADIPTRAELFNLLKETLPNEELGKISRVDKILGAGSFFVTAKIKYEEKDCVVALMRPYAKELSSSGMDMINNTINALAKKDEKFAPLGNIAYQAKISAESETDIEADYAKYREAVKIYDDVVINTPNGEFTPNVATWESYGKGNNGQVYKIMDMAEGSALTSDKINEQQKHDMAVAYVTLELCNLLSGARWDTDRHQGQQNFDCVETRENGFKKFVIGIFDTGAQIQHNPSKSDKILLGEMLYGMVRAARTGKNVAEYMMKKVKKIDKMGKTLNIDTLYIDEVQRGLTALSDIIVYQKEQKDENGKIIQEEKSLTSKEIGQIASAILESGLVDKHVLRTIKAKAVLNKLRPLRKGWLSSLSEGIKKISPSIKIEKRSKDLTSKRKVIRKDKPEAEINELLQAQNANERILGVNIKHIKTQSAQSPSIRSAALNDRQ
ncbi:MAG: M48 family metalloprotease [Alphaproteobacteria bacterium]|nr:M48 family metalloprotease [Alphaproteobacteria bacterium]